MHIVVQRADLCRVLSVIDKVVEVRHTSPLLANVVLTAESGRLVVRGTDLAIEVTTSCPAECEPGQTTVPAKRLLEIARKVVGDTVTMSLAGTPGSQTLAVKCGRSNFKIGALTADSFPTISAGEFTTSFEADFSALLPPAAFAMAVNDQARHYLEGVYLHERDGRLRAIGADGHRLAYQDGPEVEPFAGVILPRKIVGLLAGVGALRLEVGADTVRAVAGDTVFVSKVIEGSYVDYEKFWPTGNGNVLRVDRVALRAAVDRVGLVAEERTGKGVKLSMAPGSVLLSVSGRDGESSEEVPAEYAGEPTDVGYQIAYLSEMLGHVPGETVEIAVGDGPGTNFAGEDGWAGVLMKYRV